MTCMRTGRATSIAIAIVLLVVAGAAGAYIAGEYGRSRAITVMAAVGLVAALTWVVLMVVSIVTAVSARRVVVEEDDTPRNQQRPVARRTILPGDEKPVGRRRRDAPEV